MAFFNPHLLAATALSAASIIILRVIWRRNFTYQFALLTTGWLLFLLGGTYWMALKGWEFGLVYHFAIASIIAWIAVALNAEYKPPIAAKTKPTDKPESSSRKRPLYATFKFLLAGPVAGLAACIALMAISELMPVDQINQLVITGIGFPFLWGALAVWICAHRNILKQTVSILAASTCSLGILLF